jgi:hypothetical protein
MFWPWWSNFIEKNPAIIRRPIEVDGSAANRTLRVWVEKAFKAVILRRRTYGNPLERQGTAPVSAATKMTFTAPPARTP